MRKLSFAAMAMLFLPYAQAEERYCLNAVTTGNERTASVRCHQSNSDPLDLKSDPLIKAAFTTLELDPSLVDFKGCEGIGFRTTNSEADSGAKYLISYSSNTGDKSVAPVIHELGHVAQLEISGGYRNLSNLYSPTQIELGADYLVGIVFKLGLPTESTAQFERNIELAGIYMPARNASKNKHGNPSMRVQAFRLGVHTNKNETKIKSIHQDFQDNVYGTIN